MVNHSLHKRMPAFQILPIVVPFVMVAIIREVPRGSLAVEHVTVDSRNIFPIRIGPTVMEEVMEPLTVLVLPEPPVLVSFVTLTSIGAVMHGPLLAPVATSTIHIFPIGYRRGGMDLVLL